MAFAGPQHYFTTRLIYKMCGTKQLFQKSSDSLLVCCFFMFWIMQQINTSYCENLPAEFPQASLLPKQIFPYGFPQICGFFFISFSNRKMTKDSGPVTNKHRICNSGQRHHAKKVPVFRHEWLHSKSLYFYWVNAMALPVLFSKGRSLTTSEGWMCNMAPGKGRLWIHHSCPTELHLPCYLRTSFENHALCFETYPAKPSLAHADHLLDSSLSKLLLMQNISTGHVVCLLCHSRIPWTVSDLHFCQKNKKEVPCHSGQEVIQKLRQRAVKTRRYFKKQEKKFTNQTHP